MRDYLKDLEIFGEKVSKSILFFKKDIDNNTILNRESYTIQIHEIIEEYLIYINEFKNDKDFSEPIKKDWCLKIYAKFKDKHSDVLADHKIIKERFKKKINPTEKTFSYGKKLSPNDPFTMGFNENKKLSPNDSFTMGFDNDENSFTMGFGPEPNFDYSDMYISSSEMFLDFLAAEVETIECILSTFT